MQKHFSLPSFTQKKILQNFLYAIKFSIPSFSQKHFSIPSFPQKHFSLPSFTPKHFSLPSFTQKQFSIPSFTQKHFSVPSLWKKDFQEDFTNISFSHVFHLQFYRVGHPLPTFWFIFGMSSKEFIYSGTTCTRLKPYYGTPSKYIELFFGTPYTCDSDIWCGIKT